MIYFQHSFSINKRLICFLPLLLLFTACNVSVKGKNGVTYENTMAYNDYIINRQSDLIKMIIQFAGESRKDLSKADRTIDKAILKADQSIRDVEGMPEWKGDTLLRDNAAVLFKFYKQTFTEDYKRILAMQQDGVVSPEEEKEYRQITNRITGIESRLDARFKTVQIAFAAKNGFNVAETGMQDKIDTLKNGH